MVFKIRKLTSYLFVLAISTFLTLDCRSQVISKRTILAISKTDHVLAILDPATLKVIARIPIGEDPHEVIASVDGKTAYVSNTGFGVLHEINVIDLVNQKPLKNIDTRPLSGPHGLSFTGGKLWFTTQGSKAIGRFDPATGIADWSMGTGQNTTHLLYVSPDEKAICATNAESGTVSIFEEQWIEPTVPPTGKLPANARPRLDWLQTIIPVGKGSEGFDVSPDGKFLWTAKPDGTIAIVDIQGKKLSDSINTHVLGLHRLAFTPDGTQVIIDILHAQ